MDFVSCFLVKNSIYLFLEYGFVTYVRNVPEIVLPLRWSLFPLPNIKDFEAYHVLNSNVLVHQIDYVSISRV